MTVEVCPGDYYLGSLRVVQASGISGVQGYPSLVLMSSRSGSPRRGRRRPVTAARVRRATSLDVRRVGEQCPRLDPLQAVARR